MLYDWVNHQSFIIAMIMIFMIVVTLMKMMTILIPNLFVLRSVSAESQEQIEAMLE
jgi:hypothetical protein